MALDEVQDLDVEGEPVDPGAAEHERGHVGAEPLEPTLCVAIAAEEHHVAQPVDDPAAQRPQWRGRCQDAAAGMAPVPDGHVPAVLDGGEDPTELVGGVCEVGVGEGDGPAAGRQHAGAHRRALAAVVGLNHDLVGPGGQGGVGGGVRGPVVHHDHLVAPGLPDVVQRLSQPADGLTDAVGLAVGGHDHAETEVAGRLRPHPPNPPRGRQFGDQDPAVPDEPHGPGRHQRHDLGLDQRRRRREAGAREQCPQHRDVHQGRDGRHADECGGNLDPADVRIAPEGDDPVQHVRQGAGRGDGHEVGHDEDPAQHLPKQHQQPDVHQRGHQRHSDEAPDRPGHGPDSGAVSRSREWNR